MPLDEIRDQWTSILSEKWHRPYGMALMETDPDKRTIWIAEAEKAIIVRYLQLQSSGALDAQFRDLRRATDELRRLKSEAPSGAEAHAGRRQLAPASIQ